MSITDKLVVNVFGLRYLAKRLVNRTRPKFRRRSSLFAGMQGLEIGGHSHIFSEAGPIPVYGIARKLDNLDFCSTTFWLPGIRAVEYRPAENLDPGLNFYIDSDRMSEMVAEKYDFLIASHVIEHLANPIKTVLEWKRLLKLGGAMILIAPCKYFSYDCDRPTTKIAHLIEDYMSDVGEDDLTHIDEVILKHNLRKDKTVSDIGKLIERTKQNKNNRIMHHHVFDLKLLREMGERCGLQVLESEYIMPRHVACIFSRKS